MQHKPPAVFAVSVGDIDITQKINKYLTRIVIVNNLMNFDNTADVFLSDADGTQKGLDVIALPTLTSKMSISLGWTDTGPIAQFTGLVNASTSIGTRDGGRILLINAIGSRPGGGEVSTKDEHLDNATLAEAIKKFAPEGMSPVVHSSIAGLKRDFWSISGESFRQWMARTGKEVGAVFSISGDKAALVPVSAGGSSASGQTIKQIMCVVGDNVIRWSLSPAYGGALLKTFSAATYDTSKAAWNVLDLQVPQADSSGAQGLMKNWFKLPDPDQAQQVVKSNNVFNELGKRGGFITIAGEPFAQPGGLAIVKGCRPDVDNTYQIMSVTQTLIRDQAVGFETELELRDNVGADAGDHGGGGESTGT